MNDKEHRQLAERLLSVVLEAGRVELKYFGTAVDVATKSDASPVTAADQEAEDIITGALQNYLPDVPVVGEEAASAGNLPKSADTFFLVDPLDGTRDFIAGRDEFTVNVALIVNRQPLFGVVYQPAAERLFMTIAADAAIEARVAADSGVTSLSELDAKPISVVNADPDSSNIRVAVSRSHPSKDLNDKLTELGLNGRVQVGSSLKFCLVANGEADVYPRLISISEWDTAAGHAIVTAAGGAVLTTSGEPLLYGNEDAGYRISPFVAWGQPDLAKRYPFA